MREINSPAAKDVAGIQTVCWDLRVDPIPADSAAAGGGARGGGGGGGRGGGRGPVPGVPGPEVTAGYLPVDPCAGAGGGGRGGGGGGGGAGGGTAGPQVIPGTYSVSLMAGGKAIDTKPITVLMDPQVHFTAAQRAQYNSIVLDLHDLQRRGTKMASVLTAINTQMPGVATKVKENTAVPAEVKVQFDAFNKDFDSLKVKFGVGAAAAGGRGGGGGGGGRGGGDPRNVLARTGTVKNSIMGIWEVPSDAMVKQYNAVKLDLPKAITTADAFIARATAMSATLKKYDITLTVVR